MSAPYISDHQARAIARLAVQYADKQTHLGVAGMIGSQWQMLEDAIFALYAQTDIETATGYSLEIIGHYFEETKGSLTDTQYRFLLKAKIFLLVSAGEHETIVQAARLLLPEWGAAATLQSRAAYEVSGDVQITSDDEARTAIRLLQEGTNGGVRAILVYFLSPIADVFAFDTGPGFDLGVFMGAIERH